MHLQEAIVDMARQPYNIWISAKGPRIVNEAQVFRDAGITGVFPKPSDGSAVWAVWDDATVDQILLRSAASRLAGVPMETLQVKQLRAELQEAAAA